MELKVSKKFIEPVTCVNGPVGDDKYLVRLIIGGEFVGTQAFKNIEEIDKQLEAMKNDPEIIAGCEEEGLEYTLVFEISEVKSCEERLVEIEKEFDLKW